MNTADTSDTADTASDGPDAPDTLDCPDHTDAATDAVNVNWRDTPVQVPRALAGPGEPRIALDVLTEAGWRKRDDEFGNAHLCSPDGLVYVGFLPEDDLRKQALWTVHAYPDTLTGRELVWTATFDDDTPAELIAAFLTSLADPASIIRTAASSNHSPG